MSMNDGQTRRTIGVRTGGRSERVVNAVVHATLDFEGYMARKLFKGMMPAEVLQDLGIVKAEGTPPPP